MAIDDGNGSKGDEIGGGQFLPLWDRKADIAWGKTPCTAAIGSIVRCLRHKQTWEESPELVAL